MEYGDNRRLIASMFDRDTLPTWRAIAASQWGTPCLEGHVAEVAADHILTTHLIASVAMAVTVEHAYSRAGKLGFSYEGAGAVFAELRTGGLDKARLIVDDMPAQTRAQAVEQCLRHLYSGLLALQLDAGARFGR